MAIARRPGSGPTPVPLVVVRSRARPGALTLRARTDEGLIEDLWRALTAAGYQVGDRVSLVLEHEPTPQPRRPPHPHECSCAQPNVDPDHDRRALDMDGACPRHGGVLRALFRRWRSSK